MVLGIDREYAARTDRDMINIGTPVTDRYRMHKSPPGIALGDLEKLTSDELLTIRANPPGSLVGVCVEESAENCSYRFLGTPLLPFQVGASTCGLSRLICCKINRRHFGRYSESAHDAIHSFGFSTGRRQSAAPEQQVQTVCCKDGTFGTLGPRSRNPHRPTGV